MSEEEAPDLRDALQAVLQCCADSLLTAAAAVMLDDDQPPTAEKCRALAILALDVVIVRTAQEGARP
jgi:hypothetical protein